MRSATVLAYLSIPSTLCCRQRRCEGAGTTLYSKSSCKHQNDFTREKIAAVEMQYGETGANGAIVGRAFRRQQSVDGKAPVSKAFLLIFLKFT
jgi:hypothetical protein